MQEILESLLSESGTLVAVALVVAVLLIAALYWVVRRLSGLRLGGIGRGRVPRLAVVDATPVDSRRRLVLVRRDNVEHLILIGGPSDLVVEPSIVRSRPRTIQQPAHGVQQPAAAVPAGPVAANAERQPSPAAAPAMVPPAIAPPTPLPPQPPAPPAAVRRPAEPLRPQVVHPDPTAATSPADAVATVDGENRAERVGDLERDMARLIGEIDTKHSSV